MDDLKNMTVNRKEYTTSYSEIILLYNGRSKTGQGMNSARRFASTCLEWMASMLIITISKLISSAISPMIAVGLLPSPSRSKSLYSVNPPDVLPIQIKQSALVH